MTQWQKMTPEQKKAQMERNTYYRHLKKAKELGVSIEEYRAQLGSKKTFSDPKPKKRRVKPEAPILALRNGPDEEEDFGWEQFEPENVDSLPERKVIKSVVRPWITFQMEKGRTGGFIGYKVIGKSVDEELKASMEAEEVS